MQSLKSVNIPKTLTEMKNSPFLECNALEQIDGDPTASFARVIDGALCSYSLDTDEWTLICYPAMKRAVSFTVPRIVARIGEKAFYYNDRLEKIYIHDNVKHIEDGAFKFSRSLCDITLPAALSEISAYLFEACRSLRLVKIPAGIEKIGFGAFEKCVNLAEVEIPPGVKTIEYNSFYRCKGIKRIVISKNRMNEIKNIFPDAFSGGKSPRIEFI